MHMWVRQNGHIECDVETCGARFGLDAVGPAPEAIVIHAARAQGWHCYRGPSITSKDLDLHICPRCLDIRRGGPSRAEPLPDDVPMFDVVGDVLVTADLPRVP